MTEEDSESKTTKELDPSDASPSIYTFKEYSCSPCNSPPNKGSTFRNIHCVGLKCNNCVWDQSIPPLLSVDPGDIVTVECLDASGGQIHPDTSTAQDLATFDLSRVNPLHGPIFINGAQPGDTLEVEVVKLQPGTWGWTGIIPNFGLLSGPDDDADHGDLNDPELREKPFLQIWKLDGENGYTEMFKNDPSKPCIRIPIHPFTGEMGVAPKNPGPHSQVPPDDHGGNVDCKHLVEGSKVYFPVFVDGALFSIGDGHAAQGEGEVCGTAIECPMKVDIRFKILKDKPVEQMEYLTPGPLDRFTNTGQWYFTTGIAPSLMRATKMAIKRMLVHLNREYGLSKHEAMVLCSVAVDLKIHQAVDAPNWTVGAGLPLSIFHKRKRSVCVIGGTGCAGTPTVQAFLKGGYDQVTVLSRGGAGDGHFGRAANDGQNKAKQKRMESLQAQGVKFIACNRMTEREKFRNILAESQFDVIVDYWAMTAEHVQDVIDGTSGYELSSYIFVSTNMVYKGGPEAFDVRVGTDGPWLKEYDVDVSEYARSCPDSYGGRKVFCEALLKQAYTTTGFPYTALRMPSVIGPQADWRWSKLQDWVAQGNPIDPHGGVGNKFRIVYSGDIGKACYLIANNSAKTVGEAINFCQDETPTYAEFLTCLSGCLGDIPKKAATATTITEESPFSNYEGQWILDTSKAKRLLDWETTPMEEWMKETVEWHKVNDYFSGGDLPVADKAIR